MIHNKNKYDTKAVRTVKTMPKLVSGFTLIELLVVIAIIGILASVVLSSLNTSRAKGTDAAVKANLTNIRAQAQDYYDTNGDFGDDFAVALCDTAGVGTIFVDDTKITSIITTAGNASNSGGLASGTCTATLSPSAWAISVPLKTDPALSWCVDSTGASKQVTGPIITDSVCP